MPSSARHAARPALLSSPTLRSSDLARPTSIDEIAELLRQCASDSTPVTPAGSQTSTTAASITDRGVLLSLRAMDRIGEVDVKARTMRSEEHSSELQSPCNLVCRLLLGTPPARPSSLPLHYALPISRGRRVSTR